MNNRKLLHSYLDDLHVICWENTPLPIASPDPPLSRRLSFDVNDVTGLERQGTHPVDILGCLVPIHGCGLLLYFRSSITLDEVGRKNANAAIDSTGQPFALLCDNADHVALDKLKHVLAYNGRRIE